jgi:cell volume regulation protein A
MYDHYILIGAALLFMSVLAGKTGYRFGVPVLLLFLGVGMLTGNDGLKFVIFDNADIAQFIGVVALCFILFSGGMDTKYGEIKQVVGQGVVLATAGVLFTALFTGIFIYYACMFFFPSLHIGFLESLLLASVMSSTDSASVFAILRTNGITLRHRLRPLLELESGSNDPMAYMLTITLIQLVKTQEIQDVQWSGVILMFFAQLIIGAAAGWILGKITVRFINRLNIDNDALYPVLLLAAMLFIFATTNIIHGNSFLAVYIGGMVIGNKRFVHKRTVTKFFDGMAWLFQIVMFLTLGLLVRPMELPEVAWVSIAIGLFMIIVARPIAVLLSLAPFRKMTFRDRLYVSWVGLRGAVPIVFALYPLIEGVEHARIMFNIVFFCTIISLLVQGTTLSQVAKWLDLVKYKIKTKRDFDIEFAEEIKSSMMEITVTEEMLSNGHRLMDLSLPEKTLAVMAKRSDSYFIPKGHTEIKAGDKLLLISDDEFAIEQTYKELGIPKEHS